ncbi:peptidase family M28 protein [Phlyctema vagabunda]|uniref:Peptide hydrolase n=1 Tax=Phlyctema vagabunda TaxID=108571 RepID=A0ABR4PG68_9HELO
MIFLQAANMFSSKLFPAGLLALLSSSRVTSQWTFANSTGNATLAPLPFPSDICAIEAWPTDSPGVPYTAQLPDSELTELLSEIDPARVEAIIDKLVSFGTRHTLSNQTDPVRGIGAARNWLLSQYQEFADASDGYMTVELQSYIQPIASRIDTPTNISNIVATLKGSSTPERIVVVSGHYDSRVTDVMNRVDDAPGADDDASGVAISMELARVLAKYRPASTMIFAAVAGEEQGLYGSTYLAQTLANASAKVVGMWTNDIVGSPVGDDGKNSSDVIRLFSQGIPPTDSASQAATRRSIGGENDSPSRQLARFTRDVASNEVTGMSIEHIYRADRYLRSGDHVPFLNVGYAANRFTEPREDFDHQHQDVRNSNGTQIGDLAEFCDFNYIARVGRVNGAVMWSLANGPASPSNVTIDTTQLTNDSTLFWLKAALAASYEIVWRPTNQPYWTHVIPVGDVTTATVKLSKDNVVFGVRSVGANGYRSPAVFPFPR